MGNLEQLCIAIIYYYYYRVKIREVKGKAEKERYTHLNAEFQIIARRDKKALLNDQCKEIEGKNIE